MPTQVEEYLARKADWQRYKQLQPNHPRGATSRYEDAQRAREKLIFDEEEEARQRQLLLAHRLNQQGQQRQADQRQHEINQLLASPGSRYQTAQGRGQQTQSRGQASALTPEARMRLESELAEEAAQKEFERKELSAGTKSRYDIANAKQQQDFDLRKQKDYWDRYRDENRGLSEQQFTQSQEQATNEISQRLHSQFSAGLEEVRGKRDNLDEHGKNLLASLESDWEQLRSEEGQMGKGFLESGMRELLGDIAQINHPSRLKPQVREMGGGFRSVVGADGKEILVPRDDAFQPFKAGEATQGGIITGPDGRQQILQPQNQSFSDPREVAQKEAIRRDKFFQDILKQKKRAGVDEYGEPILVPYTPEDAMMLWDRQNPTPPTPEEIARQNAPPPDMLRAHQMMDDMNRERKLSGSAPSQPQPPRPGGMLRPNQPSQSPRPQSTPINPDVSKFVRNHAMQMKAKGLSTEEYLKTLPPDQQKLFLQALQQLGL